jgi:PKD domain-containing protein/beta-propeller repeat-containing protein
MIKKNYTLISIIVVTFFCFLSISFAQSSLTPFSDNVIFIENQGQIQNKSFSDDIKFMASTPSAQLFFAQDKLIFVFAGNDSQSNTIIQRTDLRFINSNPNCSIISSDQVEEKFNYYYNHCPNGIRNVSAYKKITYKNIYPKIDLVFYQSKNSSSVKYDFVVRPGGNPEMIKFAYSGAENIEHDNNSINILNSIVSIKDQDLFIYQVKNRTPQQVEGSIVFDNNSFSFAIDQYDETQNLVIDPNIIWSRLFGGKEQDHSYAMVLDSEDNIYITGHTFSSDLLMSDDAFQKVMVRSPDIYVAKFDQFSKRVWSTFYGGKNSDYSRDLSVDENDNIYVSGQTFSEDFPIPSDAYQPTFAGGQSDAYIISFDKDGGRNWATFWGGKKNDKFNGIVADRKNNFVFATGWTQTEDGIPDENCVLFNFNKTGGLVWGEYFGGDSVDIANDIAIDSVDDVIITGRTFSKNFPMHGNSYQPAIAGIDDMFIIKFNNTGIIEWSTYFGGSDHDKGFSVAIASDRTIYITGTTQSEDFPVTNDAYQNSYAGKVDVVVAAFTHGGTRLYASYLGGDDFDYGESIALDSKDNILLAGGTYSADFPIKEYGFKDTISGTSDAFAFKFLRDFSAVEWSGFIGGNGEDLGYEIAPTKSDNVIITGDTWSSDFPIIVNDEQEFNGEIDAFLMKLCKSQPVPEITYDGMNILCEGDSLTLDAGEGYLAYIWSNDETTRKITIGEPGLYWVTVFDTDACAGRSETIEIIVHPKPDVKITGKLAFCEGEMTRLESNNEYISYKWSTEATSDFIWVQNPGTYYLTAIDENGCFGTDTVEVIQLKNPTPEISGSLQACMDSDGNVYITNSNPESVYTWAITGGTITSGQGTNKITVTWDQIGAATMIVTETNQTTDCKGNSDEIIIQVEESFDIEIQSSSVHGMHMCEGESIILDGGDGFEHYKWSTGEETQTIEVSTPNEYWVHIWSEGGCEGNDTVLVYTHPLPTPSLTGTTAFCLGDTAYIETTFNEDHDYSWEVDGGRVVGDDDANSIKIIWDTDGIHKAAVTETLMPYGCSTTSEFFDVLVHPTPLPEIIPDGPLYFCEGDSVQLDAGEGFKSYWWSTQDTTQTIWAYRSGTYQVRVTSEFDCKGVTDIIVKVDPIPDQPDISEFKDSLFSTSADNYQWYRNGELIPGANKRSFYPTESGDYSVEVSTKAGCENISDPKEIWRGIARAIFKINPDTLHVRLGDTINIPVELVASTNLNKVNAKDYTFYVKVNRTVLKSSDQIGNIKILPDHYLIPVTGTLSDTIGPLGSVNCKVYWGDSELSRITLDSISWGGAKVINTIIPGYLNITDLCKSGGETRLFIPTENFAFKQNRPNPFSDKTIIEFTTIEKGYTVLYIVDLMGRVKDVIYEEFVSEPGKEEIPFNSKDLPSGIYFYILKTPTATNSMQMNIVK